MSAKADFRRRAAAAFVFGFIGFVTLLNRPRLQTLHAVDLISLIGSGMCFGVALMLFVFAFKSK